MEAAGHQGAGDRGFERSRPTSMVVSGAMSSGCGTSSTLCWLQVRVRYPPHPAGAGLRNPQNSPWTRPEEGSSSALTVPKMTPQNRLQGVCHCTAVRTDTCPRRLRPTCLWFGHTAAESRCSVRFYLGRVELLWEPAHL